MNEPCRAFGCDLIINDLSWCYYPVDKLRELPGRRLVSCNYERCVIVTFFFRIRNTAPQITNYNTIN